MNPVYRLWNAIGRRPSTNSMRFGIYPPDRKRLRITQLSPDRTPDGACVIGDVAEFDFPASTPIKLTNVGKPSPQLRPTTYGAVAACYASAASRVCR